MLNNWAAVGRVASVSINRTGTGTLYINFSLAIPRDKAKGETEPKTDFINCCIIGKSGEYFEKYIEKGDTIAVTGPMQSSEYQKEGQTVKKIECYVTKYHFITSPQVKGQAKQQPAQVPQQAQQAAQNWQPSQQPAHCVPPPQPYTWQPAPGNTQAMPPQYMPQYVPPPTVPPPEIPPDMPYQI